MQAKAQTPDRWAVLDRSTGLLRSQLARLRGDQWEVASTCPGWSVRDLANHVIGGAERYRLLLTGAHPDELGTVRVADHVGCGAAEALDRYAAGLAGAFREAWSSGRVVDHRAGPVTVSELLTMRVVEQVVHAWDLGASVGDRVEVDDELCRAVLGGSATIRRLREHGFYAGGGTVDEGAPLLSQVLGLTGRRRRGPAGR